ncbi:MAG: glycosyltransferase family 4 protein [Tepidisphaeraceae bacterium]|jgi:glycosyltransferase involved in cell wall biosynthesis
MAETASPSVLAIHPVLEGMALNPQAGGKDLGAGECTDVLLEMGCQVSVWPLAWGGLAASEKILSRHHEILWGKHGRIRLVPTCAAGNPLRGPQDLVDDVLREHRPRLLHVHQTQNPLVRQVKEKSPQTRRLLSNHSGVISSHIDEYDWIVVPSRWMRDQIVAQRPDLAPRVQTIPYFLQPEYAVDAPEEPPRSGIIFIGLLNDARKGLDTLLDAMALLKSRGEIYPLTVIGEGAALPRFQEQARRLALDVKFPGRLERGQNADRMRRSNLFCMPSREENFPIVYIESLSCGTPIIGHASAVGELSRILECEIGCPYDGERANVPELADMIALWMRGKCEKYAQHREAVKQRVRAVFAVDAYRAAYRDLYQRLLAA